MAADGMHFKLHWRGAVYDARTNLFGESARGRTPKQVVDETLKDMFPEAIVAYEIPNAMVGYQHGYGEDGGEAERGGPAGELLQHHVVHLGALDVPDLGDGGEEALGLVGVDVEPDPRGASGHHDRVRSRPVLAAG